MFKKGNLIFLCLLILGVFLITSCLPKPPVTEGVLKGQVIVPEGSALAKQLTGQALSDATVNIIDLSSGEIIATVTTDANGYYQVFVPAGGPYLLQAVKDGVKVLQTTPQVEIGIEYDLGTADCSTTTVALIAQAMLDAEDYPNNPADINLTDIEADTNFNDVMSIVCSKIEDGGDPTESALVQQAIEDILHPPAPTPTPTPPSLSDAKAITAFDFKALAPDVVGVINEGAKTIALTVPFGTDVTALVPTIVHTGVSVSPASGAVQDFTSPVTYTATAEDASTQAYLVTVTVAAPVITTTSTIANGAAAPTVTVTGTNFKAGIVAADLTVGVGTTGLTLGTVSFVSATEITVAFTGTAAAGDLTIQAKTSAFDPASLSVSNTLTVTVPAAVIDIAVIPGVTVPVAGATPVTTITETAQYTGTVTWSPADDPFQGSTVYIATITLTAKAGFTLTGVAANFFTVAGTSSPATNDADLGVVTAEFPETAAVIDIAAIPDVTAPVTGATPVTTITATAQYTGIVTWVPADDPFRHGIVYIATITLTAKAGFTLTGVAANFFTVAGATIVTNTTDSGVLTVIFPKTALAVGDSYGGGIVAYILQSGDPGYDANEQHGLIAATADQNGGVKIAWSNITDTSVGTTGTVIGTGRANTTAIVGQDGCTSGAAKLCDDLTESGYIDWYLPSQDELNKLYINKGTIGGFDTDYYWSSSEDNADLAWGEHFSTGYQYYNVKSYENLVRAVRAF